ncbi:uncharacterized protein LOC107694309 [Sinocyclocheilus anshuiensis]|uniref:uncharacterized protein LOC107694309 n=1 Tax=Sinocyclocheilus anshuiensis TaxID=1608454 RepID=UPI0007B8B29B|nr:PREDICTED: uncharacterized protein LOC107694309 [Sinocyclocheilus anshuiensis]
MSGVFLTLCVSLLHGASGVDSDEVSVMEGDSVTLNTDVETNQEDRIMWYFNYDRIAQITGNHSKICTDDVCPERFRDRLKLDHVTASLTITNTRTTDSGLYKVQIISSSSNSFSIRRSRSFSVTVTGSGPSLAAVTGICAAVVILLVAPAAGVIYYLEQKKGRRAERNQVQKNPIKYSSVSQTKAAANDASHEKTETATETPP